MKRIRIPRLRQTFDYDCGPKSLQCVLEYYGFDMQEVNLIKKAGTSPKDGTSTKGMVRVIKEYSLKYDAREMTLGEVKAYIDRKIPVIVLLQAWTDKKVKDWPSHWDNGHFVVVVGYDKKRIIFEDPSCVNNTFLSYEEFLERWHDIDEGKKLFNFGMAVYGKKPAYNHNKFVHMD